MGVPKFFRWISERFPKINARQTFVPTQETYNKYFDEEKDGPLPTPLEEPDPLSTCGLAPEIDCLYIDTNGVLHGCSHNNGDGTGVTEEDIFRNVAYYLERIISDIVQPKKLVYIAIDGVAPRAKLNQQRARRYRGGSEEMEQSIYDAFYDNSNNAKSNNASSTTGADGNDEGMLDASTSSTTTGATKVGDRLTGKFEQQDDDEQMNDEDAFHSNAITPGTEFFSHCTQHLEHWIQYKLSTDPKWKDLEIIFSGPNAPGEGEHKIMQFMRHERMKSSYDPNLRHCIMGQDGDLVMLGLATHEPNLVVLRERVVFDAAKRAILSDMGLDVYLHNCHFEWLHMSVLRDYIMYELETAPAVPDSPLDREQTIDDFVFLTFFVGNDFLPHMPALDIGDEAFDLLFHVYKRERNQWLKERNRKSPYLTERGNIICGHRLESFLQALGAHEVDYYDNKRQSAAENYDRMRKMDAKMGFDSMLPPDEVMQSKEEADRAAYRQMLQSIDPLSVSTGSGRGKSIGLSDDDPNFVPVMTDVPSASTKTTNTEGFTPEVDDLEEGFLARMGTLLQSSISDGNSAADGKSNLAFGAIDDQDLKGRYYYDKFKFSPFDAAKHRALRKAYVEGLMWNLKYYYEGCASWSWFYPYHYGPMLSDIVGIQELMSEISFDRKEAMGEPLKPFQQLMGCMPPSSSKFLPEPYRWLMTDVNSPLNEFFPKHFTVDMNGKRWPWEAVVLLPFLDARRLVETSSEHVKDYMLTEEEKARNEFKPTLVYSHDETQSKFMEALPTNAVGDHYGAFTAKTASRSLEFPDTKVVFEPKLLPGVVTPSPGFPTLGSAPIQSLWRRRMGANVFGMRSRYRTAVLDTSPRIPDLPPIEVLASTFVGTTVHINYPHLMEAYVTSLSNAELTIRGDRVHHHDQNEIEIWRHTMSALAKKLEYGEGYVGTGGWRLPDCSVAISVRPLEGIRTMPDGVQAKTYAKFEVTLPFLAAIWSPLTSDPRTANLHVLLEKDPCFMDQLLVNSPSNNSLSRNGGKYKSILPTGVKALPVMNHVELLSPFEKSSSLLPPPSILPEHDAASPALEAELTMPILRPPSSTSNSKKMRANSILPPLNGGSTRKYSTMSSFSQISSMKYSAAPTTSLRTSIAATPSTTRQFASITHTAPVLRGGFKARAFSVGVAVTVFFGGIIGGSAVTSSSALQKHGILLETRNDNNVYDETSIAPPPLLFEHGTTTLSFIFQGGIVAAVDSRASMGNFVGSKTVQKVLPISSHILGTMAGGAADCSFWIRKIKAEATFFELEHGYRMSVTRASRLLSNALYENRGAGLSVGTMIMGFEPHDGGPCIFYVDNTGIRIRGDMFSVGSGSTFALGILDKERRFDMSHEEAIALGIKAIRHATFRDAYSGGFINVYLITENGWEKVFSEDIASSATIMEHERAELHTDTPSLNIEEE